MAVFNHPLCLPDARGRPLGASGANDRSGPVRSPGHRHRLTNCPAALCGRSCAAASVAVATGRRPECNLHVTDRSRYAHVDVSSGVSSQISPLNVVVCWLATGCRAALHRPIRWNKTTKLDQCFRVFKRPESY